MEIYQLEQEQSPFKGHGKKKEYMIKTDESSLHLPEWQFATFHP
jgi:hypothetical protein